LDDAPGRSRTINSVTDGAGNFAITGLYRVVGSCEVTVTHPEFATASIQADVGAARLSFTLARGNDVRITVIDPTGAIVPVQRLVAVGVPRVNTTRVEHGVFLVENLPPGEVLFQCETSAGTFELRHDTARPEGRLQVPEFGRLVVETPAGRVWIRRPVGRIASVAEPSVVHRGEIPGMFRAGAMDLATEELLLPPGDNRVWFEDPSSQTVVTPEVTVTVRPRELVKIRM
jgi:hypothetical protein